MAGDRTQQATPQRREKARKEGDVLHSRELTSAAAMLAGVIALGSTSTLMVRAWRAALVAVLGFASTSLWESETQAPTLRALLQVPLKLLLPVAWISLAVASAALLAGVVQTGGVQIHPQLIGLKFNRVNPGTNIQNLASLRSVTRLAKSLIPAAPLSILAARSVKRIIAMPVFSTVRLTDSMQAIYQLLLACAWTTLAWAAIDYIVEWRSREQRLKMSQQEMREEFKESEGSPQVRARLRNLQRLARKRQLTADVSRAAVVVTNPTHYAVALEFDFDTMEAPKVLAKGMNLIAQEIKEQARWAGVPILENPPLAQSLYRILEPGQRIPVDLYAAVASILAYLYRQRVEEQIRRRVARDTLQRTEARKRNPVAAPVMKADAALTPAGQRTNQRGATALSRRTTERRRDKHAPGSSGGKA